MADLSSYINIATNNIESTGNITAAPGATPTPSINGFGSIEFADGTTQTTAYQTAVQYGYFTEMTYQSETVYGEAVVLDADGNTYVSYSYYDNNISQSVGGVAKFSATGTKLWSSDIKSSNGDADYSNIVSLEYVDINGSPALIATGYYYNSDTSFENGFVWYINPEDGTVGSPLLDLVVIGSNYGVYLNDAVVGVDSSSDPYAVMAGYSYNESLQKTFTPLAPSTTDKLYVSWADFNASGLTNNTEITINSPSYAGAYLNAVNATATPDGTGDGLNLRISAVQGGSYIITRVNGWSGYINGWSVPQSVRILGSVLGGTDGVNDMTFDFDRTIFNDNANNITAAVSNIQGTPISDVYCPAWNSFNWATLIGTPTAFNVNIGNQAYISRLGNNAWSKSVGGSDYEQMNSVVVDADGNTYAVGYYYDGTSRSGIVIKYDIDGVQQWAVYVDPSSHMGITLYSVDVMSDGNIICVGDYGVTTKLDSTDGSIIWQVEIDDYMSWDASFRGTATPDGDYIFANYESDNYYLYVMRVSGVDGSVVWTKQIKRYFNGSDGEMYPENDFDAQYIDCNATQVSIALTSYFNGASPEYVGLVINFPIDGENCDGMYGQYVISSYDFTWNNTGTSSTAATVTTQSTTETAGPLSPTGTSVSLNISVDPIGGGSLTTPPTSIVNGTSWANIADADGNLVISISNDNMNWTFGNDRIVYAKENNDLQLAALDVGDNGTQVRQDIFDGYNGTGGQLLARTSLDHYNYIIQTDVTGAGYQWNFNGPNLQVNQDSNLYGYDHSVGLVSMYTGSGNPVASLKSVSHVNDPNVFTSIDATYSGANIKVYNGGSVSGTEHAWQFNNSGEFVLTSGSIISDVADVPAGYGFTMSTVGLQTYTSTEATVGADYITTTGFQYTFFDNAEWYTQISQAGYAVGPYRSVPVTWAAGSTNPTGFVLVSFQGGNQFGITPASDGGGSADPGTWKFPATFGSASPAVPGGIQLDVDSSTWKFDTAGNLTLPGNTFAVNYANGTPVSLGGGGASLGNLSAAGNVIYSPASPYPTGFVNFDTGTVMALGTNNTNPVQIITDEQGVNNVWVFGASGNLTLPTNTANINYANGISILNGIGGGSYGNANVVANLAALGSNPVSTTGNITSGNLFTGGVVSATGNVRGANVNTDGLVTATGNVTGGNILTGGIVSATGNATFGNISTSGSGGNITGANVITATTFSATGTASNLVRRAYTVAAANTAVTLDNIQARIGGSPTRLYINTVSGNMTGAGTSETMLSGSMAVSSWINVPIGQGAANAFAMSGAVSTNGDTAILNLIDQDAGTGMWRITGMIANTTANLYGITIERLA